MDDEQEIRKYDGREAEVTFFPVGKWILVHDNFSTGKRTRVFVMEKKIPTLLPLTFEMKEKGWRGKHVGVGRLRSGDK